MEGLSLVLWILQVETFFFSFLSGTLRGHPHLGKKKNYRRPLLQYKALALAALVFDIRINSISELYIKTNSLLHKTLLYSTVAELCSVILATPHLTSVSFWSRSVIFSAIISVTPSMVRCNSNGTHMHGVCPISLSTSKLPHCSSSNVEGHRRHNGGCEPGIPDNLRCQ